MIDPQVIASKWAFLAQHPVYLACSGGVDSMVLLDLLAPFCKNGILLHVNYQLRGADSDSDEQRVREAAQQYNWKVDILRFDLKQDLEQHGGNLQEKARNIRYEWFAKKLGNEGFLLLAHHADDQIETFYQHLARKSGIRGLACMKERDGRLLRPLLTYSKTDLYHYAKKRQLQWNEDLSNLENKYARNKLRNTFLPFLYDKMPELKESILLLISQFQNRLEEIECEVKPIFESLLKDGFLSIDVLESLSSEQKHELWRNLGFNPAQYEQIQQVAESQKGKRVESTQYALIREKNGLSLHMKASATYSYDFSIDVVPELPTVYDKMSIYLDADKIVGELRLRPWQIGDRISPLGMSGSKLISDVLTEAGVPNAMRSQQLVLHDENCIHWCVGHKIGRMSIASHETKTIWKINLFKKLVEAE